VLYEGECPKETIKTCQMHFVPLGRYFSGENSLRCYDRDEYGNYGNPNNRWLDRLRIASGDDRWWRRRAGSLTLHPVDRRSEKGKCEYECKPIGDFLKHE